MGALSEGLALSSLDRFYSLARSILVKSETFYDQYDQAFAACFEGVETPLEIADEVWDWLADPLALPGLTRPKRSACSRRCLADLDLDELQRLFEERLAEQDEAHHGGNQLGRHRWHLAVRPLRRSSRRHPRGRREPQPQRREGRRRAPLPRLSHRREGRRAPVRAGPAPPAPAQQPQRGACPTSSTWTRRSMRRPTTPAGCRSSGTRAARTPSRCCSPWTWAARCTPTCASAASSSAPSTARPTSRT